MGFSNQSLWSSTLHYHTLFSPYPSTFPKKQKRRWAHTQKIRTFLGKKRYGHTRKKEIKEIKVGWKKRRKHRGMRRDLGHFCGPSPLFLFSFSPPTPLPPTILIHTSFPPTIPHKEVMWKYKSRCGRKEENTGDEKGFTTSLWCAKHTIFLIPTQLLYPLRLLFYAIMGENWMTKMLENWEVTDILYP